MIRIAIPNKGRLFEETIKELAAIGITFPCNGRKLYISTNQPNVKIVLTRAQDIPWYVSTGAVELGITGWDMVIESGLQVNKVLELDFGKTIIALAAPTDTKLNEIEKIAAKMTNIANNWVKENKLKIQVIPLSGALEIAPQAGIANAIIDQVSTGDTLKENSLEILQTLFESKACLITKANSDEIEEIKMALESVILARRKAYLMLNVKTQATLEKVVKVLPCLESPTVIKLAKDGEYAIHSVVDRITLSQTIRTISKAGAKDILVNKLERVIL